MDARIVPGVARALAGLLELIESDRARLCAQLHDEAEERAQSLRGEASAAARARIRQVFREQRARRDQRLAAAEARLATARRLHEQQRLSAWLRLACEQLPAALQSLWDDAGWRRAWSHAVLAAAAVRLPRGAWRIAHPADWPEDEREGAQRGVPAGAMPRCEADPRISAGLKVVCGNVVLDGTLEGLLADRSEFEARLLQHLEAQA